MIPLSLHKSFSSYTQLLCLRRKLHLCVLLTRNIVIFITLLCAFRSNSPLMSREDWEMSICLSASVCLSLHLHVPLKLYWHDSISSGAEVEVHGTGPEARPDTVCCHFDSTITQIGTKRVCHKNRECASHLCNVGFVFIPYNAPCLYLVRRDTNNQTPALHSACCFDNWVSSLSRLAQPSKKALKVLVCYRRDRCLCDHCDIGFHVSSFWKRKYLYGRESLFSPQWKDHWVTWGSWCTVLARFLQLLGRVLMAECTYCSSLWIKVSNSGCSQLNSDLTLAV